MTLRTLYMEMPNVIPIYTSADFAFLLFLWHLQPNNHLTHNISNLYTLDIAAIFAVLLLNRLYSFLLKNSSTHIFLAHNLLGVQPMCKKGTCQSEDNSVLQN